MVETKVKIEQYKDTVGAMRDFAAGHDHKQPGDPKKLSKAILKLVDSPTPPVQPPLGTDIVARIREKNKFVEAELQEWLDVAVSTDHDDTALK